MTDSSNWIHTRIDRVATVNARIGWKALTASEYQPDGYPLLATPNIKSASIDFEGVNYIGQFRYDESPELKLRIDDVLLAKDGSTLGITNIVRQLPRPSTVNGSIAILRAFAIEPRFLRYALESRGIQETINAIKGGMGVPHLFQRDIKRLSLAAPRPDEQRRIADFLDLETERIDRLFTFRRDQVAYLSEGLQSEASRLTGRDDLANGRVESDWQIIQLRRVVTKVQTGTTPTDVLQPSPRADDLPWYTPSELVGTLGIREASKSVPRSDLASIPRFSAGSILVVGIGESLGKVADLDHEATGNQQLTAIKFADSVDRRFMAWQLYAAQNELRSWAQYSRVRILNNDTLKSFLISIPALSFQIEARRYLDRRLAQLHAFNTSALEFSRVAMERREALITAAVTGQIDVTTDRGYYTVGVNS